MRERIERQALSERQVYAAYVASGRYEIDGDLPTVEGAIQQLDAALDAPFETSVGDARDRELLELMGIA